MSKVAKLDEHQVLVTVQFFSARGLNVLQCGIGAAVSDHATPYSCMDAVREALQNAIKDREQWVAKQSLRALKGVETKNRMRKELSRNGHVSTVPP